MMIRLNTSFIKFFAPLATSVIVLAALLASSPWGNTPFQDDFSFSWMAKTIAETGRLAFNGWSEPTVGIQAFQGALVIKLFGWSYEALRLSMFGWSIGSVLVIYFTARLVRLSRKSACFSALIFGLSPLVLPLESSFMTDVPSTFFVLLATYAAARAALDESQGSAVAWLSAALAATVLGVSIRQSNLALLPAVSLIPALLRRAAIFSWCSAGLATMTAIGTTWMVHWFSSQPHAYSLHLLQSLINTLQHPSNTVFRGFVFLATTIVFCLPAFSASLTHIKANDLKFASGAAASALVFFLITHSWLHTLTLIPYGDIVSSRGILTDDAFVGGRPNVIPGKPLILVTLLALGSFVFFLRSATKFIQAAPKSGPFQTWVVIQLLFAVLYFAGVIARPSAAMQPFDRYLVPVLPLLILASMYVSRAQSPSPLQYGTLALFAAFGIAAVHDYYAQRSICTAAADALIRRGVQRAEITAGLDYDSVTENETSGVVMLTCRHDPGPVKELNHFLTCAPSIHPRFIVGLSSIPGSPELLLKSETTRLWLPPFRATARIFVIPRDGQVDLSRRKPRLLPEASLSGPG
jgi:hypothetical protein